MWLLTVSVILLVIVIGFIVVANLPSTSASKDAECGCGGKADCPRCPCMGCGMPRRRCGCGPKAGGCPFC